MAFTSWISVLVMWIQIVLYVAGADQKIEVNYEIWEGNVTVFWDPPDGAPLNALYKVQQSLYNNIEWHIVPECNMTKETTCYLGNLIAQPESIVQVGLFQGNGSVSWSNVRRIRLFYSKLLAPDFHLSSTTKTVKVTIFRKQFLEKIFDFGPVYTVTLHPKGDSQAITEIKDDDEDGEVEFTSLHFLQEYCVNVTVEMASGDVKNTSLQRCIYTSADRSLVISIVTLGVVGTMSFFMFAICFFLRRPGKMPAALKSAVNGWHPMSIGSVHVETITDKGWLLMSNKTEEKMNAPEEKTLFPEEDKERRESTDSGVSILQDSMKLRGSDTQTEDDDSGCGSLTGPEDDGRRSLEELPSLDGGVSSGSSGERIEDSGLGMGNRDGSDSLKGVGSSLLCEIVVVGDGYRSQSHSGDEQGEITVDNNMVTPSGGYRSGHVTCLCSEFETCMWCKTRKLVATDCDSASHEQTNCTFTIENNDRSSYLKNSEKEVNVLGLDDLAPRLDCESSSFLISFPLSLQEGQQCQLDTSPLTLGDVELTFT